ncbi:MAG: hypothetical protein QNK37_13025 [Acidobacteriota bacterium]|nr:hypothetical protein [Acidobacteriota bacterium]
MNPIARSRNPFKNLDYFQVSDRAVFFGREEVAKTLYNRVLDSRSTLLFGESGAGKTSLIKAALIPELEAIDGVKVIYERSYAPLLSRLKKVLRGELGDDWPELADERPLPIFISALKKHLRNRNKKIVIVLDQFEEVFTQHFGDVDRNTFFREVLAPLNDRDPIRFLFAIRADFLFYLDTYRRDHKDLWDLSLGLGRLDEKGFVEAVTKPLSHVSFSYDEAWVKQLYEDLCNINDADSHTREPFLPYLQIICHGLFKQVEDAGKARITIDVYREAGCAKGMITKYFDSVFFRFSKKDRPVIEPLLADLAIPTGTKRTLSRDQLRRKFQAEVEPDELDLILQSLVREKILRFDKDRETYEFIHDLLAAKVREYLGEDVQVLQLAHRLDHAHANQYYFLPLQDLAACFRLRHKLVWTRDRLQAVILSAMSVGFPWSWWSDMYRVTLSESPVVFFARALLALRPATLRTALTKELAACPSRLLPAELMAELQDALHALLMASGESIGMRAAVMAWFAANRIPPAPDLIARYLYETQDFELKAAFLDWLSVLEDVEMGPLVRKWERIDGDIDDQEWQQPTYLEKLIALLGRSKEGQACMKTYLQKVIDQDLTPEPTIIAPLFQHVPGISDEDMVILFKRAKKRSAEDDSYLEQKKALLDPFLTARKPDGLFEALWADIKVLPRPMGAYFEMACDLVGSQHWPVLFESLDDERKHVRFNAVFLVQAAAEEGIVEAWQAFREKRPIRPSPEREKLESWLGLLEESGSTDNLSLESFVQLLQGVAEPVVWLALYDTFVQALGLQDQVAFQAMTLPQSKQWVSEHDSYDSLHGDSTGLNEHFGKIFGNFHDTLAEQCKQLSDSIQNWMETWLADEKLLSRESENNRVFFRLPAILSALKNFQQRLGEESLALLFDNSSVKQRTTFLVDVFIPFWEKAVIDLRGVLSMDMKAREKHPGWVDFKKLVDEFEACLGFLEELRPKLGDFERYHQIRHRAVFRRKAHRSLIARLATAEKAAPDVVPRLITWFEADPTTFESDVSPLLVQAIARHDPDRAGNIFLKAMADGERLSRWTPELLAGLQQARQMHRLDSDQKATFLSHHEHDIRQRAIRIFAETDPDLLLEHAGPILHSQQTSTQKIMLAVLGKLGKPSHVDLLVQAKDYLAEECMHPWRETLRLIIRETTLADFTQTDGGTLIPNWY